MKYLYYTIGILAFSLFVVGLSNVAHGNYPYVRAQYKGAVRCYSVGQEPKNMKYKHYYDTESECEDTLGHAV